jgi:hypothetical protein
MSRPSHGKYINTIALQKPSHGSRSPPSSAASQASRALYLAPVPAIPAPPPPYSPLDEGRPDWLPDTITHSGVDKQLAATILAWQVRGATRAGIAQALTAWGSAPMGGKTWTTATAGDCAGRWTRGTKHRQRALLLEYGFRTEARQHAARWRRQRGR